MTHPKTANLSKLVVTLSLLMFSNITSAEPAPLKIGLLPYLSPHTLIQRYSPLINYLRDKLDRPIQVVTAPSFATYVKRAAEHQYDLYVTAPHFAALAEQNSGYRRVARLTRELDGAVVVHADSHFTKIEELRGKTLVTPDHLAIITILGELSLQEHGIDPARDITIKSAPTHNTALLEVIEKRADAAVVSAAVFENIKPELKNKMRLIFTTSRVPHMMFLASPRLSNDEYEMLKSIVLDYRAKGEGKPFFDESGYIDMEPINDDDMQKMKAMLPLLTPRLQK